MSRASINTLNFKPEVAYDVNSGQNLKIIGAAAVFLQIVNFKAQAVSEKIRNITKLIYNVSCPANKFVQCIEATKISVCPGRLSPLPSEGK